jgi:hypothetical protein
MGPGDQAVRDLGSALPRSQARGDLAAVRAGPVRSRGGLDLRTQDAGGIADLRQHASRGGGREAETEAGRVVRRARSPVVQMLLNGSGGAAGISAFRPWESEVPHADGDTPSAGHASGHPAFGVRAGVASGEHEGGRRASGHGVSRLPKPGDGMPCRRGRGWTTGAPTYRCIRPRHNLPDETCSPLGWHRQRRRMSGLRIRAASPAPRLRSPGRSVR